VGSSFGGGRFGAGRYGAALGAAAAALAIAASAHADPSTTLPPAGVLAPAPPAEPAPASGAEAPAPGEPAAPAMPASSSPAPTPGAPGAPSTPEEGPAQAAPPPDRDVVEDPTLRKVPAERRGGLVLGVAPGVAFAGASGYPNNARLIGNPDYYSESPLLVGASTTYFLMGALTDYVSFGVMVNLASFESASWKSTGMGVGFRAEAFPPVRLFPRLADTSIYGMAGIGGTELQAKGNYPSADGTQSFAGVGVHHEFRVARFLGGHFAAGPFVEYDAIFSTSAERHWASVGLRVAWYGGTVAADQR
jgi:hypothetical protein